MLSTSIPQRRRGRALGNFQAIEMIGSLLGQSMGGFLASIFTMRTNFLLSTVLGGVALGVVTMIKGKSHYSEAISPKGSFLPSKKAFLMILNPTVLLSCAMIFIFMSRNNGLESTILPLYITEEMRIPLTQYGLMVTLTTIGSVAGNIIGGSLSDKYGRKIVLASGFILAAFATALLVLAKSFLFFVPLMFLNGISWGITYGTIPALVADSVPNQSRGMGIGIFRTFFDSGGLFGPILFSSILNAVGGHQGYLSTFYAAIILMIFNLIMVAKLKKSR